MASAALGGDRSFGSSQTDLLEPTIQLVPGPSLRATATPAPGFSILPPQAYGTVPPIMPPPVPTVQGGFDLLPPSGADVYSYNYRLRGFDEKVGTLAGHLAKLLERYVAGYRPPSERNPNGDPNGVWCNTIRRAIQEIDDAEYSQRQLDRDLAAARFAGSRWNEIVDAVREVVERGLCDDHWGGFSGGSLAAD